MPQTSIVPWNPYGFATVDQPAGLTYWTYDSNTGVYVQKGKRKSRKKDRKKGGGGKPKKGGK